MCNSRLLRFFGKYSYGLYVFHYPLIPVLILFFPMERITACFGSVFLGKIAYIAAAIAASLVLAMLSWHLYEKHFLKLKDVLASRRA